MASQVWRCPQKPRLTFTAPSAGEEITIREHTHEGHPQRTQRQQQSIISIQASQVPNPILSNPMPSHNPLVPVLPHPPPLSPTPGSPPSHHPIAHYQDPHTDTQTRHEKCPQKSMDFHICPYSYYSRGGINKSKKKKKKRTSTQKEKQEEKKAKNKKGKRSRMSRGKSCQRA